MGTEIDLTVGRITLDWSKNSKGIDHGILFQPSDLTRRKTDQIRYEYYADKSDEELAPNEATFARHLRNVLPRLNLLGHTLETARTEYEAAVVEAIEYSSYGDEPAKTSADYMTFEEFCAFSSQFRIDDLDTTYIDLDNRDEEDRLARGRFDALRGEFARIPHAEYDNTFWSERSYFGSEVNILSSYAMLQIFGLNEQNLDTEVLWQFGPLVESGWASASAFVAGARRSDQVLVATEGTSDTRVLRRAIDLLEPDIADFFRFIDVDQSHPFPGTGNLVKFAEGLVQIDVQNRIVFVLDNDAEGIAAHQKIEAMRKPPNMRTMILPELQEFEAFPTRGPEGATTSDINGRAAAIECYLDLNLPGRPPPSVTWTNYKLDLDRWQGALDHKDTYLRRFLKTDREALLAGSYDVRKLRLVLDALMKEATLLAVDDRLAPSLPG
ncbi:MAG: hypothetical protein J0M19_07175 [Sphingomonadales bacterium]|nr:hypothetical protein [Sphingomonadales bacterium]